MLFVDSSEPSEIANIYAWGVASGVTTNPLIMAREGVGDDLEPRVRAILEVSTGPVSVELLAEDEPGMLAEAERYHALGPGRICIKVPFSEVGLRVGRRLLGLGMLTNVTCVMSFNQAYLAAVAGATYVSIFSGRVRDMGYDVRPVIGDTRALLDREGLPTKLIVGSVRHPMDVHEALTAGAHVVTATPAILRRMLHNPKTEQTISEFSAAWALRSR